MLDKSTIGAVTAIIIGVAAHYGNSVNSRREDDTISQMKSVVAKQQELIAEQKSMIAALQFIHGNDVLTWRSTETKNNRRK